MEKSRPDKIAEMRLLAEEFRERARLASIANYISLMTETASELDLFADLLERRPTVDESVDGSPLMQDQPTRYFQSTRSVEPSSAIR